MHKDGVCQDVYRHIQTNEQRPHKYRPTYGHHTTATTISYNSMNLLVYKKPLKVTILTFL